MKILISAFKKDRQVGEGLCSGFKNLGKNAQLIFPDKFYFDDWRFFQRLANKIILKEIKSLNPDLYISIGGEYVFPETVNLIKQKYKIPVITWVTDEPAMMADSDNPHRWLNFSYYDHLFVIDEFWAQSLQLFPIPKTYLPLAANNIYKLAQVKKDIDILFVAERSYTGTQLVSGFGRALILNGLLKSGLSVKAIIPEAKNFFYYFPDLKNYPLINYQPTPEQMNNFYNRSKIIIHINNLLLKTDFSDTVFNIGLSKNFLITDFKTNAHKLFGKNIITVKNLAELVEKTKYYLAHELQRQELARKFHETVLSHHTYKQRAKTILETLNI